MFLCEILSLLLKGPQETEWESEEKGHWEKRRIGYLVLCDPTLDILNAAGSL